MHRISQHRYSGSFCSGSSGLLQDLMTKANIRSNLTDLIPDIVATREKGLDYVLGETNSYACHVSERQNYDDMVWLIMPFMYLGCPWCQQYGRSSLVDFGLPPLRVCAYKAFAQVSWF